MTTENSGPVAALEGTAPAAGTSDASASVSTGTATETGQAGPAETQQGQVAEAAPPTGAAQEAQEEPTFFDPRMIKGKPELEAAYKQMQKAYTQKTQRLAKEREKIEAYDGFVNNPDAVAQYLQQMGYQVARPGQAAAQPQAAGTPETRPFEPQTWDDVFSEVERRMIGRVQEQMAPVVQNIRETTAKNIESQLESIDPNWRLYEDDMKETLRQHPTLVKNVSALYRMSVPEEVQRERAVKEALAKHGQKTQSARVHGAGTPMKTAPAPRKVNSFQDAVEVAKEMLARGGR